MGYLLTSEDAIRKARELARRTGRSIDDVINDALTAQLSSGLERSPNISSEGRDDESRYAFVKTVIDRARTMPIYDTRSDDEILGYNEKGVWD